MRQLDLPVRSAKALPLAIIMTAGLMILMTVLIAVDEHAIDSPTPSTINIFQPQQVDTENPIKRDLPEPIHPETQPVPDMPVPQQTPTPIQPTIDFDVVRETPEIFAGKDGESLLDGLIRQGSSDQVAMITKRSPPKYPSNLRERGIEGYVDLAFDITPQGTTTNIRIIASWPKRAFENSAIQALKRWRYKPRRVDGKAVSVDGATTRIIFTLDKQ